MSWPEACSTLGMMNTGINTQATGAEFQGIAGQSAKGKGKSALGLFGSLLAAFNKHLQLGTAASTEVMGSAVAKGTKGLVGSEVHSKGLNGKLVAMAQAEGEKTKSEKHKLMTQLTEMDQAGEKRAVLSGSSDDESEVGLSVATVAFAQQASSKTSLSGKAEKLADDGQLRQKSHLAGKKETQQEVTTPFTTKTQNTSKAESVLTEGLDQSLQTAAQQSKGVAMSRQSDTASDAKALALAAEAKAAAKGVQSAAKPNAAQPVVGGKLDSDLDADVKMMRDPAAMRNLAAAKEASIGQAGVAQAQLRKASDSADAGQKALDATALAALKAASVDKRQFSMKASGEGVNAERVSNSDAPVSAKTNKPTGRHVPLMNMQHAAEVTVVTSASKSESSGATLPAGTDAKADVLGKQSEGSMPFNHLSRADSTAAKQDASFQTLLRSEGAWKPADAMMEIAKNAKDGHTKIELQLEPAHLGKVHVTLQTDAAKQLQVHFTVDQAISRQIIEQNMPQLRTALAQQGLDLGSFTMNMGSQSQGQGGSSGQSGSSHHQAGAFFASNQNFNNSDVSTRGVNTAGAGRLSIHI